MERSDFYARSDEKEADHQQQRPCLVLFGDIRDGNGGSESGFMRREVCKWGFGLFRVGNWNWNLRQFGIFVVVWLFGGNR